MVGTYYLTSPLYDHPTLFAEVRGRGFLGSPHPRSSDLSVGFWDRCRIFRATVSSDEGLTGRKYGTTFGRTMTSPGAGQARRALSGAGYSRLEQLSELSEEELLRLPGFPGSSQCPVFDLVFSPVAGVQTQVREAGKVRFRLP